MTKEEEGERGTDTFLAPLALTLLLSLEDTRGSQVSLILSSGRCVVAVRRTVEAE